MTKNPCAEGFFINCSTIWEVKSDEFENCLSEWSFSKTSDDKNIRVGSTVTPVLAASDFRSMDVYGCEETRISDFHMPPAFWCFNTTKHFRRSQSLLPEVGKYVSDKKVKQTTLQQRNKHKS